MVYLDTGAFLARYLARDAFHDKALAVWESLRGAPLVTSNHVLDETWTLLGRRAGYDFAAERALNVYTSSVLDVLYSTKDDEIEAVRLFRKFADQRVSFTDCVSLVLMKRLKIRTVFTFDTHFVRAGLDVIGLT